MGDTTTQQQQSQSQEAESQEQQGAGSQAGQQGGGLDTQSFAKLMQDVGKNSALRDIEKIFGTSDIEKLKEIQEKLSANPDSKKGKGDQQLPEDVVKKIQELEKKIQEKEEAHSRELNRQRLTVALAKHSPKVPGLILDHFEKEYEVKKLGDSEVVYKRGASLPEQVNNEVATIDSFFTYLATKSELSGLFDKRTPQGEHLDTSGGYVDEKNTPVTPEQMKDFAFIQAVEDAGEMTRLMATGRVDMGKVKNKLKK